MTALSPGPARRLRPLHTPPGVRRRRRRASTGASARGQQVRLVGRMAASLAQRGYVVVAVDYPLFGPSGPSPGRQRRRRPRGGPLAPPQCRRLRRRPGPHRRHGGVGPRTPRRPARLFRRSPADGRSPAPSPRRRSLGSTSSARVQAVIDFYGPADLLLPRGASERAERSIALFLGAGATERPDSPPWPPRPSVTSRRRLRRCS